MTLLEHIWGLGFTHTAILIALILIISDFFLPTDLPTHAAYVLLSITVACNLPFYPLYKVLFGLLAWFAFLALHYFVWKGVIAKFTNTFIAPTRYKSSVDGLIGTTGQVKEIEGRHMVDVLGDLWPCRSRNPLAAGDTVLIVQVTDGYLEVESK